MVFSEAKNDILVLGATGFVGRLITRYLCSHPQKKLFVLALAARSEERLKKLVEDEKVGEKVQELLTVDVSNPESLETAIKSTKVVINTVGPYWLYGTPVVAACVRNQVHYVDLTGEKQWIREIILKYDYAATKSRTIIVPSCGYDSVPSDIVAWLANKTLKHYASLHRPGEQFIGIKSSVSAQRPKGGISGGTLASIIATFDDTPPEILRWSSIPYSLSPAVGGPQPRRRFLYELTAPSMKKIVGGYWMMREANVWIVQRTFGLYECLGHEIRTSRIYPEKFNKYVNEHRYGPNFFYDEFVEVPNRVVAFFVSLFIFTTVGLLHFSPWFRAFVKPRLTPPGQGPSEEAMKNGSFTITNVTTSDSTPSFQVQTKMTGKGDPGYSLTAVMISECALSLLFCQPARTATPISEMTDVRRTTHFAKEGGVLTPMTAFGEDLITRLCNTELFTFSSYVVEDKGKDKDV